VELTYLVLLGTLFWASGHDIVKHRVPDYVFLIGGVGLLIASIFTQGFSSLFGMGKGLIIMFVVGIILNIIFTFGMADVFAVALIGFTFHPGIVPIRISLAIVFFVMYMWMKFWSFVTRKKKVPAIPGIFLGALALLTYIM